MEKELYRVSIDSKVAVAVGSLLKRVASDAEDTHVQPEVQLRFAQKENGDVRTYVSVVTNEFFADEETQG